jgi:hypothetical protein
VPRSAWPIPGIPLLDCEQSIRSQRYGGCNYDELRGKQLRLARIITTKRVLVMMAFLVENHKNLLSRISPEFPQL